MPEPPAPRPGPDPTAAHALAEISRVRRRIRAQRWWHAAAAVVMAVFLTAYYIGMSLSPESMEAWVLPGLAVVMILLGLLAWRTRAVPAEARRLEERMLWLSLALAVVTMVLNRFLVDGVVWAVCGGVLPGLPYAYLAWRVGRR